MTQCIDIRDAKWVEELDPPEFESPAVGDPITILQQVPNYDKRVTVFYEVSDYNPSPSNEWSEDDRFLLTMTRSCPFIGPAGKSVVFSGKELERLFNEGMIGE